jgi:sporulation protein YlmC with PRC-barrel domain
MIKYKSELLGLPIWYEEVFIGRIKNLVIDNENGAVLALGLDKRCSKVIPYDKVLFFYDRYFALELNPIFESKDIIKIDKILKNGLNLNKQKVVAVENGKTIGYLSNYGINIGLGALSNIVVKNRIFGFLPSEKIISANDIFTIQNEVIEIEEETKKVKQKKAEPVMDPA